MSLYDRQNALQYGHDYDDQKKRWAEKSGGYTDSFDVQHSSKVQQVMDHNVLSDTSEQEVSESTLDTAAEHFAQEITVNVSPDTVSSSDESEAAPRESSGAGLAHQQLPAEDVKISFESESEPAERSYAPRALTREILDASKHTILIVDDDYDTRAMYAAVFAEANYNVLEAVDGLEGMDLAIKHQPDAIFTGIIMPRMDGFTMIEAIRKNATIAGIPIIINSHLGRQQDKERARELGVRDFVVLDYMAPREVVDRINALLVTMEYEIPFDKYASHNQDLLADIGGEPNLPCENPKLVLRLVDAEDKKFSARLVCED